MARSDLSCYGRSGVSRGRGGRSVDARVAEEFFWSRRAEKRIDDRDKVSSFFQEQAKSPGIDEPICDEEIEANLESENDLDEWLGVRKRFPQLVEAGPRGPRKGMKIVACAEWPCWER